MITFMYFLFTAGIYVYSALCLYKMAEKTATPNAWLAWIPIINGFTALGVAKKPYWWFILFLIPIVNIVIGIIVLMATARNFNRPGWWGVIGFIIPPVWLVMMGILAFGEAPAASVALPAPFQQPPVVPPSAPVQ